MNGEKEDTIIWTCEGPAVPRALIDFQIHESKIPFVDQEKFNLSFLP